MNEASTPLSTKIEEGGFIEVVYLLNDIEKNNTLEITKKYGSGQYIEGTNASGRYIINVGGSLDKDNNTFTVLKDGKYKEGGKDASGKVLAPEVVGGSKMTVKNVVEVNVSDSNKSVVDKILTTLGDERSVTTSNKKQNKKQEKPKDRVETEAEKEERAKRIMKMAYEDPHLRKLIHYQPSILGGLIKIGKAKGLAHVSNLLDKHNVGGKDKERIKKEFLKGQVYSYEVAFPVRITYGTETINFFTGQFYKVRFDGDKFNGHVGEGSEKISYYIRVNKKSDDNTYRGTVTAEFKQKGKDKSPDWTEEKSETIVVKFRK
jgi:hypothetical protein